MFDQEQEPNLPLLSQLEVKLPHPTFFVRLLDQSGDVETNFDTCLEIFTYLFLIEQLALL